MVTLGRQAVIFHRTERERSHGKLGAIKRCAGVRYRVEQQGGKLTTTLIGGSFGRLAVHPAAMQYIDFFFQKLWTALAREKKQMETMQNIVVQKGAVTFVTKGGAAP